RATSPLPDAVRLAQRRRCPRPYGTAMVGEPATAWSPTMAEPVRETNRFPLSFNQELWCGWPSAFNPRFVIAEALRVRGHVDVAALRRALDDVVRRHEILRTVVVRDDDEPYQRVYPPGPVPLEVRDLPAGADRE